MTNIEKKMKSFSLNSNQYELIGFFFIIFRFYSPGYGMNAIKLTLCEKMLYKYVCICCEWIYWTIALKCFAYLKFWLKTIYINNSTSQSNNDFVVAVAFVQFFLPLIIMRNLYSRNETIILYMYLSQSIA